MNTSLITATQPVLVGHFARGTESYDLNYTLVLNQGGETNPVPLSTWEQSWEDILLTGYELGDLFHLRYVPTVLEWKALEAVLAAMDVCNRIDWELTMQPDGRASVTKWQYGIGTRESNGSTPAYGELEKLLANMMSDLWGDEFAALVRYYQLDSNDSLQWCFDYARGTVGNMILADR